jgi:hypothetical protein
LKDLGVHPTESPSCPQQNPSSFKSWSIEAMPPTLLLIRHAQALHNVSDDWSIHDPPLSDLGRAQCAELQESLQASRIANEVELVVVSAMRRTLETASLGLKWLYEGKKVPVLADAGWQGPSHVSLPIAIFALPRALMMPCMFLHFVAFRRIKQSWFSYQTPHPLQGPWSEAFISAMNHFTQCLFFRLKRRARPSFVFLFGSLRLNILSCR